MTTQLQHLEEEVQLRLAERQSEVLEFCRRKQTQLDAGAPDVRYLREKYLQALENYVRAKRKARKEVYGGLRTCVARHTELDHATRLKEELERLLLPLIGKSHLKELRRHRTGHLF